MEKLENMEAIDATQRKSGTRMSSDYIQKGMV